MAALDCKIVVCDKKVKRQQGKESRDAKEGAVIVFQR